MIPPPGDLFSPFTDQRSVPPAQGVLEFLAGPAGLAAFVPLIPFLRLMGGRAPRTALIASSLVWLVATLAPLAAAMLLAWLALAVLWLLGLAAMRRRGRLGERGMIAATWIGLHALALPLWWSPGLLSYGWSAGPMAALHAMGFGYFLFRLIAWGVELAHTPHAPLRWADLAAWLLYPPCMRLGPVLLRAEFEKRLAAWRPAAPPPWRQIARRAALCLLGCVLLAVVWKQTPKPRPGGADFFASPELFPTGELLRALYLVPVMIYLLLWTYNELAMTASLCVGIPVDNNFKWLPAATSVRDFWQRWHVTVGAWLRNYIYFPLGGSRTHAAANYAAVFVYCGVWHGASWSFVAWGVSQAAALAVERGWDKLRRRGEDAERAGSRWLAPLAWLATMHYQAATIFLFADFRHAGTQFFPELLRRLF
ncbi:Peptidoglycan O-acetyltransferase [Phycisphaerae bacterium RAS1]|nr:Peptidoglycan O-acetyltransferase [Phycisphaerae bacterium RAS1]